MRYFIGCEEVATLKPRIEYQILFLHLYLLIADCGIGLLQDVSNLATLFYLKLLLLLLPSLIILRCMNTPAKYLTLQISLALLLLNRK